jgi:Fur family ferric uptake transcriptional regulator
MPQTLHKQEKEQFCKLFKHDQLTDFEDRFAIMEAFMQTDGHVSSAQMIERFKEYESPTGPGICP